MPPLRDMDGPPMLIEIPEEPPGTEALAITELLCGPEALSADLMARGAPALRWPEAVEDATVETTIGLAESADVIKGMKNIINSVLKISAFKRFIMPDELSEKVIIHKNFSSGLYHSIIFYQD